VSDEWAEVRWGEDQPLCRVWVEVRRGRGDCEPWRTGSLNGDGQGPQEVSKLSTGVIRGSEEGEFSKKLVGFAVYGTQIVDCKDDKPSRGHVRVKVPGIKSMLFSSAMGRRVSRRIVRCITLSTIMGCNSDINESGDVCVNACEQESCSHITTYGGTIVNVIFHQNHWAEPGISRDQG
jgi:hypothetical protein